MTKPKKNDPLQKPLMFHSAPSLTKCSLFIVTDGLKQQVPPTRFICEVIRFGARAENTSLLTSQTAPSPSHRSIHLARGFCICRSDEEWFRQTFKAFVFLT